MHRLFLSLGMEWVIGIISLGGVVGLATTLLMGLYAQSRIYLGLARYANLRCLTLLTRLSPCSHGCA